MSHCVYNLVLLVIVYTTTRRALSSEMEASKSSSMSYSLSFLLLSAMIACAGAAFHYHDFVVHLMPVKRLCRTHNIIAVNGQYPGPNLVVRHGDTVFIHVTNRAKYNITLHWHGIRQLRTGWADGPEYVTQCPIRPGRSYTYRFKINEEEGTLWWHAHSSWLRATVYGALIIYPKAGSSYPFPKPQREFPVILGEWWNEDPVHVIQRAMRTGGAPNVSDAYTINGQPGDLYPCSSEETTIFRVKHGQTNLLRFINAALEEELFISVAGHNMTVVAADAFYTKPFTTSFLMLAPGQTTDVLLAADQPAGGRYYIAAHAFNSGTGITFDNTTTTAIVEYEHGVDCPDKRHRRFAPRPVPAFPSLPAFNDTAAAAAFSARFRSPAPVQLPGPVDHHLFFTVGLGLFNCPPGQTCAGPNGSRLAASMNNVSFQLPMQLSMLQAQYFSVSGVFTTDFPAVPPQPFDYTGSNISQALYQPVVGTRAFPVKYGAVVEVVLQGTNIVTGDEHPMHLHGYHFHVLATGTGNFEPARDVGLFNLVDPPTRNTVGVPASGWVAIRFLADNPGVWLMHCHLDAHIQWGLAMAFVVDNGAGKLQSLGPPPADLPQC